ncbi:MAG: diguanylate cyclase [Gammaproteobacteria bacterium]|nr:diguanylate cyclase [Gammaproteobacteria bacterium]
MKDWSVELLHAVLDAAPEGITICEPGGDHEVVFVNRAFARLTGYAPEELIGRNLRMLQGAARDQAPRHELRTALATGSSARIALSNFRKDGSSFRNEMHVQGIRDADGRLVCFIGHHRDAGEQVRGGEPLMQGLPSWMREDRLTGLVSQAYFEELLRRDWAIAAREQHALGFAVFDVDELGVYNDTFGRAGGDAVLRRAARLVAGSFRRGTDLVARWEGGSIAVLTHATDAARLTEYAGSVARRMREQLIHHPRSAARYVTLSVGVAAWIPQSGESAGKLVQAAGAALGDFKAQGRSHLTAARP